VRKDGINYCAGFPPDASHPGDVANVATPEFHVTSTEGQRSLHSLSNKGSTKFHFMLVAIAVDYHLAPDEYKAAR
jgi:hypothetical protein